MIQVKTIEKIFSIADFALKNEELLIIFQKACNGLKGLSTEDFLSFLVKFEIGIPDS